MKKIQILCWVFFTGSLLFLAGRIWQAKRENIEYNILKLELATADKGKALLQQWHRTSIGGDTLINYASTDTYVDFIFIIGYTGVLMIISRRLGRKQKQPWLKHLLRWCLPMALLAGLLDVVENCFLLANMNDYAAGKLFYSTRYLAAPKFILVGLVLFCWLLSLPGLLFPARQQKPEQANEHGRPGLSQ